MSKPTRSFESYAQKYPALARRRQSLAVRTPRALTDVLIGHDIHDGAPVYLDEITRLEHGLVVGPPGGGKTTYLKNMLLQIFCSGRGGIVFDPHGSHPGSLFHELLIELDRLGFTKTGRLHVVDANVKDYIVPVNFLAGLDGTDVSVLADCLLEAVESVWGDEDTHSKPTIRSVLKTVFATLAELRLPLCDAKLFFDQDDRDGLRDRVIPLIKNEYARDELERLHLTALAERSRRDFRAEVRGPINRLNDFCSSEVIRAMTGVVDQTDAPRQTLDLLEIMNKGDILLVNLQHGATFSNADARLFGALLLRYIFLLASRRSNREPFSLVVDECPRFLSGDGGTIVDILAECRKYGIATTLCLQFMAQAGKPDGLLCQGLLNTTEIKTIFRIRSPADAQLFAEFQVPLNLERPVMASLRPTVVGHRRATLASHSTSTQEAETEGEAESSGETHALTHMQSHSTGTASTVLETTGSGTFSALGDNTGMMMTPQATLFGPNADNATLIPVTLAQSSGASSSHGSSEQSATTSGTTESEIITEGQAETVARSRTTTTSRARTRALGTSVGASQAFEPVYADLPTSFHSKENELYRAGEMLRNLPVGHAFVSFRDRRVCIRIPPPKRQS